MRSYKFIISTLPDATVEVVQRSSDGTFIPFDMGNADCVLFLKAWKSGEATVLNADGSPAPYSDAAVIALGLTPL